jgi:hypothetical protein
MHLLIHYLVKEITYQCHCFRYADSAKQIVCRAKVNEDPNAKLVSWFSGTGVMSVKVSIILYRNH